MTLHFPLFSVLSASLLLLSLVAADGTTPGSCDPLLGHSGSFKVAIDGASSTKQCYSFSSLDSSPVTLEVTFSPCGPQPKPTGGYSTSEIVSITISNTETRKVYPCGSVLVPLNGLAHVDELTCQVARNELRQGEYMVDAESSVDAYSGCQYDFTLCKPCAPSQKPKARRAVELVFNPAFPVPAGVPLPTTTTCCEGIPGVKSGYCLEAQCRVTFCLPGYALRQNIDGRNVCYERQHRER